jgi:hypothetical protein
MDNSNIVVMFLPQKEYVWWLVVIRYL